MPIPIPAIDSWYQVILYLKVLQAPFYTLSNLKDLVKHWFLYTLSVMKILKMYMFQQENLILK